MAEATDGELDAGPFGTWLDGMLAAMRGNGDADVACGTCTACCRSRQFVHVGADETEALAHIPADLRTPAPGRPGDVVIGYDAEGRCPLLGENGCTIYDHRPRTCRVYDCRVFEAAGIAPDGDQPLIVDRARRWRFAESSARDALRRRAVELTAAALDDPSSHPDGRVPIRAVHRASMAIGLHHLAVDGDQVRRPVPVAVRRELERRRA
ncbi:MAG: YkgJ family cysteine cluster protein [Ilumatobacteraceae bacterium]|nr:YkgJ family cysteine cluster protein [Acidimicrobiales bacterium]MCB9394599.1 YkgJ family cysteine cluster protein [Acidimicrobiaceae bacterium]